MITYKSKLTLIASLLIWGSCNDKKQETDNAKTVIGGYDKGQQVFTENCTSCHHRLKERNQFVWPSVQDISESGANVRDSLLDKFLNDSLHIPYVQAMTQNDIDSLLIYIRNFKNNGLQE